MELLPELRRLIAKYLDPKDAFACMRVSRDWYDSFSEPAFKSITIRSGSTTEDRLPPMGWMQKYGQFIRSLTLSGKTPLPHLFVADYPQEDRKLAIVLLPNLKTLVISTHCTLNEVEKWLSHCPGLVALSVKNVKSLPSTDTDRGVHLLQHCPRLIFLDIDNVMESGSSMQVDDLAEIISHCSLSMTRFSLMDKSLPIHRPWFEALSGFLSRMTFLQIAIYPEKAQSWMVKRILCSCPLLVELHGMIFNVDDLFTEADVGKATETSYVATTSTTVSAFEEGAGMGAWVCTGLKKLSIFFIEWSASPMRNKAAMEHLGLLRDLRCLEIMVMSGNIANKDVWIDFFYDYPWPEDTGYSCEYSVEDLTTDLEAKRMREFWPVLERFKLDRWVE